MPCGLRVAAALLIGVLATAALAQRTVEVIPLQYRNAEQVIPVLQPLLGRESSISHFQNQLVVRATPAELAQIKRVLAGIDSAPKRLLITVRQDADLERDRREVEVSGSLGNDHARATTPGSGSRSGDDRLRARIVDTQQINRDRSTQTIQVLEGHSAYIRTGESRPVPKQEVVRTVVNGQMVDRIVDRTEYREANTGFHVLPRVQGDRVTLDINPQRESFDEQRRGAVNTQSVVTTVSGRLGEWISLGGMGDSRGDERSVLLGRSTGRVDERRGVQVKVEALP